MARRSSRRRGGVQDPEREEGEVVGPRLPPPAAPPATSSPGLPNEPQGPGYDPNATPTGQGRRRSRRHRVSRKRSTRKMSRRRR